MVIKTTHQSMLVVGKWEGGNVSVQSSWSSDWNYAVILEGEEAILRLLLGLLMKMGD